MSSLQKSILKAKLPRPPIPSRDMKRGRQRNYNPVPWSEYFTKFKDISIDGDQFRVYLSGEEGPFLVLLHGGGLSALGWALFAASVSKLVKCRVAAIDLRGHGSSTAKNETDLSAETMSGDVGKILSSLFESEQEPPPVILMGHSMGGAIAVHTAYRELIPSLVGLAVIDVVEGTAMEALSSMQSFLRGRPKSFESVDKAIEWCVRSGQVRNLDSARVSMPAQIINTETGELAIDEAISPSDSTSDFGVSINPDQILEESENGEQSSSDTFKQPTLFEVKKEKYKWRIDLSKTETHWPGWFKGLSQLFLNCCVPKLLILAGIDTLDRELTVGQMQGKFQMQVLPQCGHAVHEDVPDKVAEVLASFMVRFKFAEPTSDFHRPFPAC